jgi:hypothetical protein
MGKCSLCGEKTKLFKKVHEECSQKRDKGLATIKEKISDVAFFSLTLDGDSFRREIGEIATECFITSEEVGKIAKDKMIDIVFKVATDESIEDSTRRRFASRYKSISFLSNDLKYPAQIGLNNAIARFLDDGCLSVSEQTALLNAAGTFGINGYEFQSLPNHHMSAKGEAIRNVMSGVIAPQMNAMPHPFNFQKTEKLIWLFDNVTYAEIKTKTRYEGGSVGVSVRVMKGVYLRTSSFRGNPVHYTEMEKCELLIIMYEV